MSTQYVNVARFARNVECDFFCDFQTLWQFSIFLKVKNELYENDQTELEIKMGKRTSMQNMNCSLDGSIDEPLENQVGLGINASRMSITTQLVMFKFDSLHASFVH